MKKYFGYAAAAVSALTMAAASVPAFAAENTVVVTNHKGSEYLVVVNGGTENESVEPEKTVEPSEENKAEMEDAVEETKSAENAELKDEMPAETAVSQYAVLNGDIKEVTVDENGNASILFNDTERGEIFFKLSKSALLIADNALTSIDTFKAGMKASVVIDGNSPMTMSLPPQSAGVLAVVAQNEEMPTGVFAGMFDENLANEELVLNVGKDTNIIDIRGSKQMLRADDIKNNNAIVLYTVATASLPAQTNPEMVILIGEFNINDAIAAQAEADLAEGTDVELA